MDTEELKKAFGISKSKNAPPNENERAIIDSKLALDDVKQKRPESKINAAGFKHIGRKYDEYLNIVRDERDVFILFAIKYYLKHMYDRTVENVVKKNIIDFYNMLAKSRLPESTMMSMLTKFIETIREGRLYPIEKESKKSRKKNAPKNPATMQLDI